VRAEEEGEKKRGKFFPYTYVLRNAKLTIPHRFITFNTARSKIKVFLTYVFSANIFSLTFIIKIYYKIPGKKLYIHGHIFYIIIYKICQ